jgi:hypothetical protein
MKNESGNFPLIRAILTCGFTIIIVLYAPTFIARLIAM